LHTTIRLLSITFNLSIVLFSQHRPASACSSTDVINPTSLAPLSAYIYRLSPSEDSRSKTSVSVSIIQSAKIDRSSPLLLLEHTIVTHHHTISQDGQKSVSLSCHRSNTKKLPLTMQPEVQCCISVDIDAVAGWLGSYGGEDSTSDISRGTSISMAHQSQHGESLSSNVD
jgi:hypothetical protein